MEFACEKGFLLIKPTGSFQLATVQNEKRQGRKQMGKKVQSDFGEQFGETDDLPFVQNCFLYGQYIYRQMNKAKSEISINKQKSNPHDKNPTKDQEEGNNSYWDMMIEGIVRPPRAKYHQVQLGQKVVRYKERLFLRNQHDVVHESKKIQLTIYSESKYPGYIILYMHGNSSCRLEALGLLKFLPNGISLGCFDFMGCGKNEQMETISLGYRQSLQAASVCQFLREKGYEVILWGRSMGAATALLYGKARMIIADSSYKSFKSLCKQVAKEHSPTVVPNCMITCFFPCVFSKLKKDVDKRAKYDVEDLDVKEAVKSLDPETIVVFMSGEKDVLIMPRNSQKLHDICPCKQKYLRIFEGDHNSKRPQNIMKEVMGIVQKFVIKHNLKQKPVEHHYIKESEIMLHLDSIQKTT